MGYCFPGTRQKNDLNPVQRKRYEELRSKAGAAHWGPALRERLATVKEYIGPITSGEIWSAREELVQDAFVAWIIAGENPEKVEWVKLEREHSYSAYS